MRLDAYLSEQHPELSRSQLKRLILDDRVMVNGAVINKPSFEVDSISKVSIDLPSPNDYGREIAKFSQSNIIYQNEHILVINKPAGMLTHAKGGACDEFTVADYVRALFNSVEADENKDNNRLGIVHRLDRATSGVLICARDLASQHYLQKQFSERKAHKTYWALVKDTPAHSEAQINLPLARNLKKPATFAVNGKGKIAITNYRVLAIYSDNTSLLELKPLTGRTHQLRVHLSHIGHPIIGDPVYGDGKFEDRLMLHAKELEITIPTASGNQRMTFQADLPADFQAILEAKHEI